MIGSKKMRSCRLPFCTWMVFVTSVSLCVGATRPNIILIMTDDMGYSDVGCYGGEIPTPNIDQLAANGVRFSRFYNTSRCCPTRASMLTGLYQHQAGVGHMTSEGPFDFDYGVDGYRGNLNRNCVTLAEVLKGAGYHTYMVGKWHLGGAQDDLPIQRGFEKFYGSPRGAFSYFSPTELMSGNESLATPDPATFYSTDAFGDTAVEWLRERKDGKPFFLYMAFNAPHWPLHAKESDIKTFVGSYMKGWDEMRKERFARQVEMGLFDESLELSPRDSRVRAWSEVSDEQKKRSDYRMAVYAAQVSCVDQNIGKVLDVLKQKGELSNTLIMFLSDNGACAEPYAEFGGDRFEFINNPEKAGAVSIGIGWANACNTPFRKHKNRPEEGGISTPFIASWPKGIDKQLNGSFIRDAAHIIDIMPTLVELSGATYPREHAGQPIYATTGISLLPLFQDKPRPAHDYLFFEHENNCAVLHGDWKVLGGFGALEEWELYNLKTDRTELHNVAAQHPEIVADMEQQWQAWAVKDKVVPKGSTEGKGYGSPKK